MSGQAKSSRQVSGEVSVFRDRSVSYLELPSASVSAMADFYEAVFDWRIRPGSRSSFTDGSGHVIGHFIENLAVAGDAGPRPYIYVAGIDAVLGKIAASGGEIVKPKYEEGNLWVATFRDPSGNVLGVWEHRG